MGVGRATRKALLNKERNICSLCAITHNSIFANSEKFFLRDTGLITIELEPNEVKLTQKGEDLLNSITPIDRIYMCIKHAYLATASKIMRTLSEEELPVFLCNKSSTIREIASDRLKTLKE